MNLRRKALATLVVALVVGLGVQAHAQPVFENRTPRGFSPSDSTVTDTAITGNEINVLVDLNEPANFQYPVTGNFQQLERSIPFFSAGETAGYMSQAIAVDGNGVVHRAWVQNRGKVDATDANSTPVYGVVYAKSFDGGRTFSDTVSVSGSLRFDLITPNVAGTSAFSTVDLVVNSKGNPRVVYAMDSSADGIFGGTTAGQRASYGGRVKGYNSIYFNYSNDGGSSWLPANNAAVLNDTATIAGRKTAFPRMAIGENDDIYVVYEHNQQQSAAAGPDIRLTKVPEDSLKLGSGQAMKIGSRGQAASRGGIRLHPAARVAMGPDIALGDDDVLHVVWTDEAAETVSHKTVPASLWSDVTIAGWDQEGSNGATVGSFDHDVTNFGVLDGRTTGGDLTFRIATNNRLHLFPTVVVDRARTPDRVYVLWKHTDETTIGNANDENIAYTNYTYDGNVGGGAAWPGAANVSMAFPAGTGHGTQATGGLFQNDTRYQVESTWAYVDRIAVAVDDRRVTQGDLHIVFSGGPSAKGPAAANGVISKTTSANNLYYSSFNGVEWEMPQVVATARDGQAYGVYSSSQRYQQLFEPDLAVRSGDDNLYLSFVGGSPRVNGRDVRGRAVGIVPGRGDASGEDGNIAPVPFFKVIGRVLSFDDVSLPKGANTYMLSYTPTNPLTTGLTKQNNMVQVTVADNQNGTGIGAATPPSAQAPGGFLAGQWRRITAASLGVASLTPGTSGAVYKGAVSQNEAQNDNGVWEGLVDDDGARGFAEWGDDADKVGLLVKLNVLASNSSSNVYVINASSAAQASGVGGTQVQALNLKGYGTTNLANAAFLRGRTGDQQSTAVSAPIGSYFQIGARIDIIAENESPVVAVSDPNASSTSGGAFANETFVVRYTLYDEDDSFGTGITDLKAELYASPDNGLGNVQDVRTYAYLIVDETDDATVSQAGLSGTGTSDFVEGSSSSNVQSYTWDNPGTALEARGWAAITKIPDGLYYIYLVADDGTNPPVYAVSAGPLRIRHIPIIRSVAPVAQDTVDTGEYSDLNKVNPYKVKFTVVDYNHNAQVRLFYATVATLNHQNVSIAGTYPSKTITVTGATAIELSDTLRSEEDISFDFDVTAQGVGHNEVVPQGSYYLYAVSADNDSFAIGVSTQQLAVRHSPAFEFTAPLKGTVAKLNTTQQFKYTVQWQRGRSDQDLDGNAYISLYYTGVDPLTKNYSGTDSTTLVATSGTNAGNAVLLASGLREDDEGGDDQFVWDFRNPPSELPNVFRPNPLATATNRSNKHVYQAGATVDTAWVYAVLHDTLGNTRVEAGGAVLLLGSAETPASPVARVVMKTPPSSGMSVVNGDVVRLEWDDFMIDDGTGTDDAYLRLYAAPRGKYTTLTDLEKNNVGKPGGGGDVFVINSLDGTSYTGTTRIKDYTGATQGKVKRIRESNDNYFMWDTKTTSFRIQGTPTEFDIFVAASTNPRFGENIYVNTVLDSVATGIGSRAQQAVLSKAPGALRVDFADPIYSIELGPGAFTASSGDTLDFNVLVNSQASSINLMALHLNVPRNYFEVIDQNPSVAGVQPFADSTGAFQTPSTIAQNDTTPGTAQFLKLNFVESIINGEVVGNAAGDSSQVAAKLQLKVKRFSGGAGLDTLLVWSTESGRKTAFRSDKREVAAPARDGQVVLTPRARLIATAPLEGRTGSNSDTLDIHVRLIGSTQDITDTTYIAANDVTKEWIGGVLEDSVQVVSDAFGTFSITEIPAGIYEMTAKARGYVTGRTDTLTLFDGAIVTADPTYGSDLMGNLSPATPLGWLRGGDATGDNQVDIADANRIFSLWNLTPADAGYVRDADVNADAVINTLDLQLVTTNFGNSGFGAPPVFKANTAAGDNSAAMVEVTGIQDVDAWWAGKVFEVTTRVSGMSDVTAFGFTLTYDPERVMPLGDGQAVQEGDVFADSPRGALFLQRVEPGRIEVASGRIGRGWSASGDGDLATVRFVSLGNDPGQIEVVSGELVNSEYRGASMRVAKEQALPKVAALYPNFPNPFNPETEIRFDIPTARDVELRVYNQLGQTVRTLVDQRLKAGAYRMQWDGTTDSGQKVSSGVYFYSLEAEDFSQIRKMVMVK
ncbi:MAG: FlgD immunoglobulin-like domain containing protein [Candidatus Latescibacterota bacterium]